MTKNQIIQFLKKNKKFFLQKYGVVQIGLFGSYARGEETIDSDIDIAIELLSTHKNINNFFAFKHYLEEQLQKTVDLGIESTIKPVVKKRITKELIHV